MLFYMNLYISYYKIKRVGPYIKFCLFQFNLFNILKDLTQENILFILFKKLKETESFHCKTFEFQKCFELQKIFPFYRIGHFLVNIESVILGERNFFLI